MFSGKRAAPRVRLARRQGRASRLGTPALLEVQVEAVHLDETLDQLCVAELVCGGVQADRLGPVDFGGDVQLPVEQPVQWARLGLAKSLLVHNPQLNGFQSRGQTAVVVRSSAVDVTEQLSMDFARPGNECVVRDGGRPL